MTDWNHSTPLATAADYARAMVPLRVEGADPTNPALDTFEQVALASVIAAASSSSSSSGTATAQPVSIDLFVNLAAHTLPPVVTAFIAGGFANGGVGGGTYVADSLATAALASSCPRFCAADRSGRYFRLVPHQGKVAISQGGAMGTANNDQPAVQAAINYCMAIGCRELVWDFDTVSLWNPLRTTAPEIFAPDGQSIVVSAPIKFTGLPTQTHIKLLSITGASLETSFQTVSGQVWRGSGIKLMGGPDGNSPNAYNLSDFAMQDIWLDGGCLYTGARGNPTPASPDGADLFNKGIHSQGTQLDKIALTNVVISGFKGESYYMAGTTNTVQTLRNVTITGSNQSMLNPSVGNLDAEGCYFGDGYFASEILGRNGGRIKDCRFANTIQVGATGGPDNGFAYGDYAFPTRDLTKPPIWFDFIDCEFINCGQFTFGNFVRVLRPRITDTEIVLNLAGVLGSMTSTYLVDVTYTVDQRSYIPLISIQGPATLTTDIPGVNPSHDKTPPINDLQISFKGVHRTANAVANGRYVHFMATSGYFDQNSCFISIAQADGIGFIHLPNYGGVATGSMPLLTCTGSNNALATSLAYPLTVNAGPYAIVVSNPEMSLQYAGTAAAIACTMSTTIACAVKQKTRIYYGTSTAGTTFTFARNGTGLRLNSDCVLSALQDYLEVQWDGTFWRETWRSVYLP